MTTQLTPGLLATHAVLIRPGPAAHRASAAELWPMLVIVLGEPGQAGELFDGLNQGSGAPNLRSAWSIGHSPTPVLRLALASDPPGGAFRTEVVVPAQPLLNHLEVVSTARSAALTTSDRAHHLTSGTSLEEALHNVLLISGAPVAELDDLARATGHAGTGRRHLQLAT